MIQSIIGFELAYRLRQPGFYVTMALVALGAGILATAQAVGPGARSLALINQPYGIASLLAALTLLTAYIPIQTFTEIVRRDAVYGMRDLVRSTPARDSVVLLGRFIAAFILLALVFVAAEVGFEVACRLPWVDAKFVGAVQPLAHLRVLAILVLPTLFILGGLSVLVASVTRTNYASFAVMLGLYMLYAASLTLTTKLSTLTVGALLDPFGIGALHGVARFWSNADKATLPLPFTGLLAANRLMWGVIAVIALVLASAIVSRRDQSGARLGATAPLARAPEAETMVPGGGIEAPGSVPASVAHPANSSTGPRRDARRPVVTALARPSWWAAFKLRLRFELSGLLRTWTALVLIALPALIAIPALILQRTDDSGGLPVLPVTASIAPILAGAAVIPLLLFTILYAGEMIWRERNAHIGEIIDATNTPSLVYLTTKLAALATVIMLQLGLLTLIGIAYQLAYRAPQINPSYYLAELFLNLGVALVMLAALTQLIHVLAPNRIIGHVATIATIGGLTAMELMGIDDHLLTFASSPSIPLSDMNGLGHHLKGPLWFNVYWISITVLIVLAADLLRGRGMTTPLLARVRALPAIPRSVKFAAGFASLTAIAVGSFIFWNTHVLNTYQTARQGERDAVDYEKAFAGVMTAPQPRITGIEVAVDLRPENRSYTVAGSMVLTNKTKVPITTFHVDSDDFRIEIAEAAEIKRPKVKDCCSMNYVTLAKPLLPGAALTMTFAGTVEKPGFTNAADTSGMRYNGTFLRDDDMIPSIGFTRHKFLEDERRRQAFKLAPLPENPPPGDPAFHNNYIRHDSDFVNFAITVSTSPDQIAVAPGYLKREWEDKGRRYFRYEMDKPIVNFWSVVSARYAVARDKWNDVELSVHYHPAHAVNVQRMIDAMKTSLAMFSKAFGPFQHRQMRVVEFPYGTFAQSFPNTVPYAEMIGFIADPAALQNYDYITAVTAHEVGHQWWAHQVISADVPGATLLSETLADYSSLLVMEHTFGFDQLRSTIKRSVDTYLKSRGNGAREHPLVRVLKTEPDIAYAKGGVSMFALKQAIGEATVNRALAQFIKEYGGKSDPYPTSADLLRVLKSVAGPAHADLIGDLFERITLWDFSAAKAVATKGKDGKWHVVFDVAARKLESDESGVEKERPMDQDVDIGLFTSDPRIAGARALTVVRKRIKSGTQALELVSDTEPMFAAINPYLTLIQRTPDATAIAVMK